MDNEGGGLGHKLSTPDQIRSSKSSDEEDAVPLVKAKEIIKFSLNRTRVKGNN